MKKLKKILKDEEPTPENMFILMKLIALKPFKTQTAKDEALTDMLDERTLAEKLNRQGMAVSVLHGDRSQSQRNSALTAFQHGTSRVLVATDVASRGIHVDDIAQVINYDLPAIPEDFIHRVGRTGRAGATGSAITFYSGVERSDLARIERTLQLKMRRGHVETGLIREERAMPVDVSSMRPEPIKPGSRMVRLPGEVFQRYTV